MTLSELPADLSVSRTAALLRVRRAEVLRAVLTGALPSRRIGCRLVVPVDRLLAEFGVPSEAIRAAVTEKEESA